MKYLTGLLLAGVLIQPARGHHSDAGMSLDTLLAFEGTVAAFNWRNPHVYVRVETDVSGQPIVWELQMGTTNGLTRRGWTRETLAVGDRVRVRAHPANDGRPYGVLETIDREGGIALAPITQPPAEPARTGGTLAGTWRADVTKLVAYPGGYDGFFRAQLKLTDAGRAAEAAYDPLSDENPESTCIGRPTPAAIVSSHLYLLGIEIDNDPQAIIIRSEYFDEERTVYLDGRQHPDPSERFRTGHSIGRWEGDTLVVDTRNFDDHRSPYQIGVPSGAQKHVVERYRLIERETRMTVEFMLEDPEYLAEPMTHSRELIYSPHEEMYRFNCDPDATRRFVR